MAQKQKQAPVHWSVRKVLAHFFCVFFFFSLLSPTKKKYFSGIVQINTALICLLCTVRTWSPNKQVIRHFVVCTAYFCPQFLKSYYNSVNPQTLVKSWNFLQYNFLGFCPAIETVCQIHLSLDHTKSSLIITNPNLHSCQDNRVNIINRNCFCQTGNHSWSLTPMFTLSKTVCKFANAKENSKWSLMPF